MIEEADLIKPIAIDNYKWMIEGHCQQRVGKIAHCMDEVLRGGCSHNGRYPWDAVL
jgi:hypothetical protein